LFAVVYTCVFLFGVVYIYRLLRRGPAVVPEHVPGETNPKRPLSFADDADDTTPGLVQMAGETRR
jgi:hypothetical protein